MKLPIQISINQQQMTLHVDPLKRLIDVLREELALMGTKEGCGEGECGACSVFVDGKLVNACLMLMGNLDKAEVLTIEWYKHTERYKILETAFVEAGAVQCGFCTPAMIMAAETLLKICAKPTKEQIRDAISGNICRCTGYNMIVEAIYQAGQKGEFAWK
ncbi:ferredoxin [Desulfuribacillus stibiiarsenatis]|uniref:Ferredoxin n=1 Tax=Desulfuribacillus stibiiarsenatis TaxID=1390249 RepID=A0A1E5L5C8_9FIRM|nr:(2Fe-2S)-binding protein [Desulfuribacillus stibiiarsenatis]OEH85321.1 ferredoxin [Desulfuribacillus stibiiarsenatis]